MHSYPDYNITDRNAVNTNSLLAIMPRKGYKLRSRKREKVVQREALKAMGLRIKAARQHCGLTQEELGRECKWKNPQSRISQYEHGKREPTLAEIIRMAAALREDPAKIAFATHRLSEGHQRLISAYDKGTEIQKALFMHLCDAILNTVRTERRKNNRLRNT